MRASFLRNIFAFYANDTLFKSMLSFVRVVYSLKPRSFDSMFFVFTQFNITPSYSDGIVAQTTSLTQLPVCSHQKSIGRIEHQPKQLNASMQILKCIQTFNTRSLFLSLHRIRTCLLSVSTMPSRAHFYGNVFSRKILLVLISTFS